MRNFDFDNKENSVFRNGKKLNESVRESFAPDIKLNKLSEDFNYHDKNDERNNLLSARFNFNIDSASNT